MGWQSVKYKRITWTDCALQQHTTITLFTYQIDTSGGAKLDRAQKSNPTRS